MTPPRSFEAFSSQFHADLDITNPDLQSFKRLYEGFRTWQGDDAVMELAAYFEQLRGDDQIDLEAVWFNSKADFLFSGQDVRRLFEDFENWAASLR
ncbi:hypothetical protein [Roseovarius azorensis]|nr:hypothetical protein [Roseovarius azorensis]